MTLNVNNKIELLVQKEIKKYCFICDNDSPLGEVFDALSMMRGYVFEKLQDQMKKVEEEKKTEDS